jgi:hypothetical protein
MGDVGTFDGRQTLPPVPPLLPLKFGKLLGLFPPQAVLEAGNLPPPPDHAASLPRIEPYARDRS